MITKISSKGLSGVLFSKTRRAVLALLYSHSEESYYLREIVRASGLGLGTVQRELKQLTDAGILCRTRRGNQVYYWANTELPIFKELKSIIAKTAGIADTLRTVLSPVSANISLAFIYGSVARGEEKPGSDIDLIIIGNVTFSSLMKLLQPAQTELGREINFTVYSMEELKARLADANGFLQRVITEPKMFLFGSEDELKGLVTEWMAGRN